LICGLLISSGMSTARVQQNLEGVEPRIGLEPTTC
jgi:hypothetical protein